MDFDPTLLFIIIFLLAPLLERLLKKGKQQQPPPPAQRPRQQRLPGAPPPRPRPGQPDREPQRRMPAEPAGTRAEAESSAADMLPDDLWAILTGQPRPRPPEPPPEERPAPVSAEARREPSVLRRPQERPGAAAPLPKKRPDSRFPPQDRPGTSRRLPPVPVGRPTGYDARTEAAPDEEAQIRPEGRVESYPVEGYVREIPVHKGPEIVSLEELVIDDEKRHLAFHDRMAAQSAPEKVRRPKRHALGTLLQSRDDIRRGIVISEVLGKPRGLQEPD